MLALAEDFPLVTHDLNQDLVRSQADGKLQEQAGIHDLTGLGNRNARLAHSDLLQLAFLQVLSLAMASSPDKLANMPRWYAHSTYPVCNLASSWAPDRNASCVLSGGCTTRSPEHHYQQTLFGSCAGGAPGQSLVRTLCIVYLVKLINLGLELSVGMGCLSSQRNRVW